MRLQKYLSQSGIASRRRAEELIASGVVTVNGLVVKVPGTVVKERDRVEVEGTRALRVDSIYRVLLKPRECLSTLGVMGDRQTLRRYVGNPEPGLAVVAPLDYPAEGVVLLTTDGELAAAVSKRGQKVPMTYHLKLQGQVGEADIDRLTRGWHWENVDVRPLSVSALATTGKNTWIEMVVAESRPRALKAAGDIIRHSVLKISRVRLGSISFEGLKMGEWRDLSKGELADLRQKAGLGKADNSDGITPAVTRPIAPRPSGGRSAGGRSPEARPDRARPTGGRPSGPRPPGARPSGPRPTGDRPSGPGPTGGRPSGPGPTSGRPSGPRPPGHTAKPGRSRIGWATGGRRK